MTTTATPRAGRPRTVRRATSGQTLRLVPDHALAPASAPALEAFRLLIREALTEALELRAP